MLYTTPLVDLIYYLKMFGLKLTQGNKINTYEKKVSFILEQYSIIGFDNGNPIYFYLVNDDVLKIDYSRSKEKVTLFETKDEATKYINDAKRIAIGNENIDINSIMVAKTITEINETTVIRTVSE